MMYTQLENLPNELFFIIFTYFNGVDLWITFLNLNTRINWLLGEVASHQSLDLTSGSVSYKAFRAYVTNRYGVRSSIISSLKADCLSLSPICIKDLFFCFMNNSISNRLQRLILFTSEFASVEPTEVITLLEQMMMANEQGRGRLEHLTLNFNLCGHYYAKILTMIIQRNISFNTMILNVTEYIRSSLQGCTFTLPNETNLQIIINTRPLLRNTVRLSLSLQHTSDLVLLLQRGVLPLLQQLNVNFHHTKSYGDSRSVRFKVDESIFLTTDTTRLRLLSLRNLPMKKALCLIRFLHLTQLETLRLINISVIGLQYLAKFERAISIRLYNLITLQFILRCSIDTILPEDQQSLTQHLVVLQNDTWQSRGWFVRDYIDTYKRSLYIYTVPYALSDSHSIFNDTFIAAQQPEFVNLKTHKLLSWTCAKLNPSSVDQSLKGLSQARHLHWTFRDLSTPMMMASSSIIESVKRWSPMQLRSLWLFTRPDLSIEDHAKLITQMLFVCPHLRTLMVHSQELALCLEQKPAVILRSLDHLHLYVDTVSAMPDPAALAAVFPNISYLSTGKVYLEIDIELGHVALDLIKTLPHLRRLLFKDYNFSKYNDTQKSDDDPLEEMIRNSEQMRNVDCYVKVSDKRHLAIWL